ncbi:MAG TPA: sigma-70 family RNA polymerase sigma factor [Acidimicrobiia bacterium]|nr:sigma-70 family RNA polymerase sigma factor [Acidimicrobiia bacterium]
MPSNDFPTLIDRARNGVPSAWDALYRELAPAVAGYLRLHGAQEPDDLTSEVFLAVFRNIKTFLGTEANFRSWVFVIAHRRLQDERRRRGRRPVADAPFDEIDAQAPAAHGAETEALRALATARVREICAELVPDQRDVLLLRIVGDLSIEQVAEVLGKSPGAVKQLQRRAFEAVRRLLDRQGVTL